MAKAKTGNEKSATATDGRPDAGETPRLKEKEHQEQLHRLHGELAALHEACRGGRR